MKIIYFANLRLPTEKAHGLQIVKTCEALASQGANLQLIVPKRKQIHPSLKNITDPLAYYQITTRFPIIKLPCLDLLWIQIRLPRLISHWPFYLQELTFAISCLAWSLTNHRPDYFYTRSFLITTLLSLLHKGKVVFELHNLPPSPFTRQLYRLLFPHVPVIAINRRLQHQARQLGAAKVSLAPDAASPEDFHLPSKTAARKQLHLPPNETLVLYTGSFDSFKGVRTLAQASKYLQANVRIYLVGGSQVDQNIQPLHRFIHHHQLPRIHLIDQFVPHAQIPLYRAAADLLVIPNSAQDPRSKNYASPLKLFQYLASGRPLIASQVPAIQEIVTQRQVFFFRPDDPQSLAQAINQALQDHPLAQTKTRHAQRLAHRYTWTIRAQKILAKLK